MALTLAQPPLPTPEALYAELVLLREEVASQRRLIGAIIAAGAEPSAVAAIRDSLPASQRAEMCWNTA